MTRNPYRGADALQASLERVAETIARRLQQVPGGAQVSFTEGIVDNHGFIETAVNATHDFVNHAVSVADLTSAVIMAVKAQAVDVTEMTLDHAQAVAELAAQMAANVAADAAGAHPSETQGGGEVEGGDPQASAARLIAARRQAIMAQRNALRDRILAKRREIIEAIDAVRNEQSERQ